MFLSDFFSELNEVNMKNVSHFVPLQKREFKPGQHSKDVYRWKIITNVVSKTGEKKYLEVNANASFNIEDAQNYLNKLTKNNPRFKVVDLIRSFKAPDVSENMDHSKDGDSVDELKSSLLSSKKEIFAIKDDEDKLYDMIDKMMTRIAKSHGISGQKLHDLWVEKYKLIPDEWILKQQNVNESSTNQFVRKYLPWLQKELGLKKLPNIKLLDKPEDKTFGKYGDGTLYVVTGGRHPVDVLRTLAHELTHFKQDLNDELTAGAGETGTPQENEANSNAGIIMRTFAQNHPEEFGLENKLNEEIGPGIGKELELMLAGKKPAALIDQEEAKQWVDAVKQHGWTAIKMSIPAKFGFPSNYSTYIISTDPQRAQTIQQLLVAGWDGSQPINKEYHAKLGHLLGYSAFDIAHFIMRGAIKNAISGTGRVLQKIGRAHV